MFKREIEIVGADVPDLDGIVKPDYPIKFVIEYGEKSLDDVAQEKGKSDWYKMHGETPDCVYYR